MSTEFDSLWGDLDKLEKELENRIQQRREILGSLSKKQIDLSEAVEKARSAGIELFDEENLSIDNLRQQLDALESLRDSEEAYRDTIESMEGYYQKARVIKLRLELTTRLQGCELTHRKLKALSDRSIKKTREYLEQAQLFLDNSPEDDTFDNLTHWLEGIEKDNKMLLDLAGEEKKALEEVQKQLEEGELDPKQRQKLLDLHRKHPNSRLLNHLRQKDSFYRLSQQKLAETAIDPEELKQCKNQIIKLVQTFKSSPSPDLKPQLEELQILIATRQQAYIWQQIFGDWFISLWQWWSIQANQLSQELDTISTETVSDMTVDQLDQLISRLRDSLNQTDAVVFALFEEQWTNCLSSVLNKYCEELSKLSLAKEDRHEKITQTENDLEKYKFTLMQLAAKKGRRGRIFWNIPKYGMSQCLSTDDLVKQQLPS